MRDDQLRADLLLAFPYSWRHDDWVEPLDACLEGLTAAGALAKVGTHDKCIWEIVLHLAVWNENIVERMASGEPKMPPEGHWPPLPESVTEEAWEAAQNRLRRSLAAIEEALAALPMSQIAGPPWGIPDLLCRMAHMGYHLGQFVIIRTVLANK